jgi:hypothetical protein
MWGPGPVSILETKASTLILPLPHFATTAGSHGSVVLSRRERYATSEKGGAGEMGGSIVSGKS